MKVGNLHIPAPLFSAPLSGISDAVFRLLAAESGAVVCCSEMVSARGLIERGRGSMELLDQNLDMPDGAITAAQIFGSKPDEMAEAASIIEENGWARMIDINMGCPVKKVVRSGAGSALMKDPELASKIISSVRKAISLPLTVKIRSGWDEGSINATDIAKLAEDKGVDAVIVHPRTRAQGFTGKPDFSVAASVAEAVNIPVIVNGDIYDSESAQASMEAGHAQGIMIGRASLGNPFVFREVRSSVNGNEWVPPAQKRDYGLTAMRHMELLEELKGACMAGAQMKKHLAWYSRGKKDATTFRSKVFASNSLQELKELTRRFFEV